MKRILLLFFLSVLFVIPNDAQRKSILLTDQDKAAIIKSVLLKSDLLNKGLSGGEKKEITYISSKYIAAGKLPEIQGINFILIDRGELEEKTKTGFLYYEFGQFKIKGSKVSIDFGSYFENTAAGTDYTDGLTFTFKKVKGKWIGDVTKVFGAKL